MKPSFAFLLSALIATATALPVLLQRNTPTALVKREEESTEDADDVNVFSSYKPKAERVCLSCLLCFPSLYLSLSSEKKKTPMT